jgi:phosphoribosylamine-glycine ligase
VRDGRLVVSGGRVLNVVGTGQAFEEARERAYRAAGFITFEGKTFRRDIGQEGTVAQEVLRQTGHELREVTQA